MGNWWNIQEKFLIKREEAFIPSAGGAKKETSSQVLKKTAHYVQEITLSAFDSVLSGLIEDERLALFIG